MSKTNLNKTLIYQLCNANNKFNYKLIVMNLFNFQKEHLFCFYLAEDFFRFQNLVKNVLAPQPWSYAVRDT